MKIIESRFRNYQIMIVGICLASLSILFVLCEQALTKGAITLISSVGLSWYPMLINVCILELFPKDASFWMQIAHGIICFGALIGPYIVFLF